MKNKKNEKKQSSIQAKQAKEKIGHGQIVWKIVAIAVIVVFAGLILGGIIKARHIRSSFVKPTQAQLDYAAKIATEKLHSTGSNVSSFQVENGMRMRRIHNGIPKSIIQVSFYNNTTTHTYLIDVDTGEVLLHSQTDIYKEIEGSKPWCGKDEDKCKNGFKGEIRKNGGPEFGSPLFSRGFFGRR